MKTITLTIIAVLCFFTGSAQWTDQTDVNTPVAPINDLQTYSDAAGTSDGQTYTVFWKPVNAPINYELRVQLLDADGYKQFGDDGMLVSDQIAMGTYTVTMTIATDANDNLFIGATGTGGGGSGHVFKIDTAGNNLWSSNGVIVGSGNIVTVLPLLNDDVVVSWMDASSGSAKIQKYDSSGSAIWSNPQDVNSGGDSTAPAHLFELADGGFIEIYHKLMGFGINSNLYAQRFDSDGNAQWGDPVQLSNNATAFNRFYDYTQIGDTIYMGYSASQGTRFDSYLQRLNPDGTLPWSINGADFDTAQTDYEMGTKIAHDSGSQYIWAICTYSNSAQGQFGEYVQKFDKETGGRQLTDNAKEVFSIGSSKVHQGDLQLMNDSPVFLITSEEASGGIPTELSAVKLDENGDFANDDQMEPMATYDGEKSRVHFTKAVNGQAVAIFSDQKDDGIPMIYAQNYVTNSQEACAAPTGLTATAITSGEAELGWTENGSAAIWTIEYGPEGFELGNGTVVNDVDSNPYLLSDLDAGSNYDFYVQAICGEGEESNWAGPKGFVTEMEPCNTPSTIIVDEISGSTADVSWTPVGDETQWTVLFGESGFDPSSGDGSSIVVDNTPETTLTGLDEDTTYDVYVRAVCSEDNQSDWSNTVTFTTEDLSVESAAFQGFGYYPNPVKNSLHLKANSAVQNFEVFNLLGQKVMANVPGKTQATLNMSTLQTGLYIIKVEVNGVQKSFKLIKK